MKKITLIVGCLLIGLYSHAQQITSLSEAYELGITSPNRAATNQATENARIITSTNHTTRMPVTLYTNRATFQADFGSPLTLEDFDGGPGGLTNCGDFIDSLGSGCFPPGEINDELVIDDDITPGAPDDTVYIGPGFFGNANVAVGSNYFVDFTRLFLPANTTAAGADISLIFDLGDLEIRVFNASNVLINSSVLTLSSLDSFIGVIATEAISRIEYERIGAGDSVELLSMLEYGGSVYSGCANDNPQAIDDFTPVSSTVTLSGAGVIGAMTDQVTFNNLSLNLQHDAAADLVVTLTSPAGTVHELSSNNGGTTGLTAPADLLFVDGEPSITTWAGGPPAVTGYEAEAGAIMAAFAGEPVAGDWTVTILDGGIGDEGDLFDYCIEFVNNGVVGTPPSISCPVDVVMDSEPGVCTTNVTFANAAAIDAEDGDLSGDVVQTAGLPSGSDFPVGVNTVTFEVTDSDGNTVECSFTITIQDNEDPVAVCSDFTLTLDAAGMGSITVDDIDGGSTDNCPMWTLSASQLDFDCGDVGDNTVTLTVTDASGNTATCDATVTVVDDIAPVIVCEGEAGGATYAAAPGTVIDGSAVHTSVINVTDDVTIDDVDVDLDISHSWIGDVNVTLTSPAGTVVQLKMDDGCAEDDILATLDDDAATSIDTVCEPTVPSVDGTFAPTGSLADFNGESTLGDWTLTVLDVEPVFDDGVLNAWALNIESPDLSLPMLDVVLDSDGMATVLASDLVVSADDACGVTVTVVGGVNIEECGDNIGAVIDSTLPPVESVATVTDSGTLGVDYTLSSVTLDITHTWTGDLEISLVSPAGTTLLLSENNGGSDDNYTGTVFQDGGADISAASAPFTGVFEPEGGTFEATFGGEDINGDWTLIVDDEVGGDVGTLDSFCINFSQDSIVQFDCSNVGNNEIEVTVTDPSGNSSTCIANVNVIDDTAPVVVCQDVDIEIGEDGTAVLDPTTLIDMTSSVEACGYDIVTADITDFDCDDIGTPVLVTIFVADPSGNIASCSAMVTAVDVMGPSITCPDDVNVAPDATGVYTMEDYLPMATIVDNCSDPVSNVTQDPAAGTALGVGVYTVTISAEDDFGNVGTCTFELTVDPITGVEESELSTAIAIYPNPADGQVTISNKSSISLETAAIFDVNGKLVNTINLTDMQAEKTIDVSALASGVYMVQITGENAVTVKRLIKK